MKKKLCIFLVLLVISFNIAGCNKKVEPVAESTIIQEKAAGWEFSVEDIQLSDSLKEISTTVGYGGSSSSSEILVEPMVGNSFLLINMTIDKLEGSEIIDWNKLTIVDSTGNVYPRLYDSFLEDFGLKRMKGTSLSFGTNQGWIAFEVDKNSKDFMLQYEHNEGTMTIKLQDL